MASITAVKSVNLAGLAFEATLSILGASAHSFQGIIVTVQLVVELRTLQFVWGFPRRNRGVWQTEESGSDVA